MTPPLIAPSPSPSATSTGVTRSMVQDYLDGTKVLNPLPSSSGLTPMDKFISEQFNAMWSYTKRNLFDTIDTIRGGGNSIVDKVEDVQIEQIIVKGIAYRIDAPSEIANIINQNGATDPKDVKFVAKLNNYMRVIFPQGEIDTRLPPASRAPGVPSTIEEYLGCDFMTKIARPGISTGTSVPTSTKVIITNVKESDYEIGGDGRYLIDGSEILELGGETIDSLEKFHEVMLKISRSKDKKFTMKVQNPKASTPTLLTFPNVWFVEEGSENK